jgi:hypothetical protein
MKTTFADAYYFLALLNPNDRAHERALQAAAQLRGRLLTTAKEIQPEGLR